MYWKIIFAGVLQIFLLPFLFFLNFWEVTNSLFSLWELFFGCWNENLSFAFGFFVFLDHYFAAKIQPLIGDFLQIANFLADVFDFEKVLLVVGGSFVAGKPVELAIFCGVVVHWIFLFRIIRMIMFRIIFKTTKNYTSPQYNSPVNSNRTEYLYYFIIRGEKAS